MDVSISGNQLTALIDSGSTDSYINESKAKKQNLKFHPSAQNISIAQKSLKACIIGHSFTDITIDGSTYPSVRLGILKGLCSDIILGQDFQRAHNSVRIDYGGNKPDLVIPGLVPNQACALTAASIDEPSLSANLHPDCKPIATKSRQFSKENQELIDPEVTKLLSQGIIEPSTSPWSAQVVVSKDPTNGHKKRLCVDYSQTVNQYTELDAYPLPRIDSMINNLAQYKVFSPFDLKSAYHQVQIKGSDRKYTGFEADGRLYQFCHIPFGVTNGVAVFQCAMDKFVVDESLEDTFPYLDNITVAGRYQAEHDANVRKLREAVNRKSLTLNERKSIESMEKINILSYCVGNGVIAPDEERLQQLKDFPLPRNIQALRRVIGMFAYYAKWIPNFSDKIRALSADQAAQSAFATLKK